MVRTHKTKTCAACGKAAAHNAVRKCVHCDHSFGIEKLASDARGRRFKCCTSCGQMASSNRAKHCNGCGEEFKATYKRKKAVERRQEKAKRRKTGKLISLACKRQKTKTMSNANIVASPLNEAEWLFNDVQETYIPPENAQLRQMTRNPSITPISRTSSLQPFDQTNNQLDVNLDIGSLFSQESSEVQDASIEEFLKEINHELTSELFDNTSGPETAQQDPFVPTYINGEAHPELDSMDLAFLDEISNGVLGGVELEDEVSV